MHDRRVVFVLALLSLAARPAWTSDGGSERQHCDARSDRCGASQPPRDHPYSEGSHSKWKTYLDRTRAAEESYVPCGAPDADCFASLITTDLEVWKEGISQESIHSAKTFGTHYQIINHTLYRDEECMFPFRCSGIEHFLMELLEDLPDMDMIINTRDWPQSSKFGKPLPVFSFSKTNQYWDITYPAWTFWEGGPAIGLYPTGLGRWDKHRLSITKASQKWPWNKKTSMGFFRGSRTSAERDPLILLSRNSPHLINAKYTKNQAWKSEADTLFAEPASEVSLEDHCQYKYLFNFRGVAASFRFKHLFLCKSVVFHVGDEWIEFFYPAMKPWVHYIPLDSELTENTIADILQFAIEHDAEVNRIAQRGYKFIWDHLRMENISSYWKSLLQQYSSRLIYQPVLDPKLKIIEHKAKRS